MAYVHPTHSHVHRDYPYDGLLRTGIILTSAAALATVIALAIYIAKSNSLAVPSSTPTLITPGTTVAPFVPGLYGAKVALIVAGSTTGVLGTSTLLYGVFRRKPVLVTD